MIIPDGDFPKLLVPQVAMVRAEVRTGIVLDANGARFTGTTKKYLIFENIFEARAYANDAIKRNSEIEFWISDENRNVIESIKPRWTNNPGFIEAWILQKNAKPIEYLQFGRLKRKEVDQTIRPIWTDKGRAAWKILLFQSDTLEKNTRLVSTTEPAGREFIERILTALSSCSFTANGAPRAEMINWVFTAKKGREFFTVSIQQVLYCENIDNLWACWIHSVPSFIQQLLQRQPTHMNQICALVEHSIQANGGVSEMRWITSLEQLQDILGNKF